jgi:hypothetical protein
MSRSFEIVWVIIAVDLLALPLVGYAQDKGEFRDQAKEAEAQLREFGEPMDRCSIGAFVAGDGIITRTFSQTDLMPGDRLLLVNGVNVSESQADEIIALLREINSSAVIPITLERTGEFVDIEVACSNARPGSEALLDGLDLAGRGKFDDCVEAFSQRDDFGTAGAMLKAQCASLSRNAEDYDLAGLTYSAMRMVIEDAQWVPSQRPEIIQRLRAVEGSISRELGPTRFQELVAATRAWLGGEQMFDAAAPDWALFRRNSETSLRARLIDPESALVEWPYGFLYGSWKPFLSKRIAGYWTCGSVNARNRLGGYTGRSSFVVVLDPAGSVQYVDIGESDDFDILTGQCNNSVAMLPPPPPELSGSTSGQSSSNPSIADELAKLVDLRNSGALTEAEFEAAKARLLGTPEQQ